jgi:hypothetical protein
MKPDTGQIRRGSSADLRTVATHRADLGDAAEPPDGLRFPERLLKQRRSSLDGRTHLVGYPIEFFSIY